MFVVAERRPFNSEQRCLNTARFAVTPHKLAHKREDRALKAEAGSLEPKARAATNEVRSLTPTRVPRVAKHESRRATNVPPIARLAPSLVTIERRRHRNFPSDSRLVAPGPMLKPQTATDIPTGERHSPCSRGPIPGQRGTFPVA